MIHMTRKTAVAAAVCAALGIAASPSSEATEYVLRFDGPSLGAFFTMIKGNGEVFTNNAGGAYTTTYYGYRTPISGTLTWDTTANGGRGGGTMIVEPFDFAAFVANATNITLQAIGDGNCTTSGCGPGNLVLGNMGFTWGPNTGIPVPIVWDATGLLAAINSGTLSPDDVITNAGVYSASENSAFPTLRTGTTYPMGLLPLAATEFNATATGITTGCTWPAACNPSGMLPLVTDTVADAAENTSYIAGDKVGVPGAPMPDGPFPGYNANFDVETFTVLTIDGAGSATPPAVSGTLPTDGTANVATSTTITVSFTKLMKADTVSTAFTLMNETAGIQVTGAMSPSGVGESSFTFIFTPDDPLLYLNTYRATVSTDAVDTTDNALTAPVTWGFTVQARPSGQSCTTPTPEVPLGGNFTMLNPIVSKDKPGWPFGGTNDVVYDFGNGLNMPHNPALLNNSASGTLGILDNIIASNGPHPFFCCLWSAHNIRLFGPGTYTFNTGCTVAELRAGTPPASCAVAGPSMTMIVGADQIGAHMLFDWNTSTNIDVVNVWNLDAQWSDPDNTSSTPTDKNNLHTGERWEGPAGFGVDPATIWSYVSTDNNSDGINGVPMADGPFIGYYANFNLGPQSSCVATANTVVMTTDESSARVGGPSCSLNTLGDKNRSPLKYGDLWLIGGFLAWLRLVVMRRREKARS